MKKKKHAARRAAPSSGTEGISHLFLSAIRAVLISVCIGGLVLLAMTAAAFAQADPEPLVRPLGGAASALTVLTAGFLTVRLHGRQVLLCGLFAAALVLLIYAVLSFLPAMETAVPLSGGLSAALHAAAVPLSIAGAYLGRRRR